MLPQARQLLSDDHQAVGEVLKQLLTALENRDVPASYSKLDLFWARLAVHIRAEHLHLFPTVINRLAESRQDGVGPDSAEAQSVVDKLRDDHDFFMRELGRAIAVLRELRMTPNTADSSAALLTPILESVREIEKRLAAHNEAEETQIYRWAGTVFTEPEQVELAAVINAEFENRPPRFSLESWRNTDNADASVL